MGKALVIKGTNFLANKLATVNLGDVVPCTAIALSEDSISFTGIGQTQSIVAEVTPDNTTDSVEWFSSNEDVATVQNGVVTCTGVGSATITAVCGEQSASCSVTAIVVIDANTVLSAQNGYANSGTDLVNNKDYAGVYATNKTRVYLSATPTASGYKALSGEGGSPWNALYPIMIPNGATKIAISAPAGLKNHVYIVLMDSTKQPTYNIASKGCKCVSNSIDIKGTDYEFNLTDYSGYDSFVFNCQTTGADASTVTGDVTVTIS